MDKPKQREKQQLGPGVGKQCMDSSLLPSKWISRDFRLWAVIHCGASLVVHWWRFHLPMQETCVQSLDWEDPLEKEITTHSSILAWESSWSLMSYSPWGGRRVRHDIATKQEQHNLPYIQRHLWEHIKSTSRLSEQKRTCSHTTQRDLSNRVQKYTMGGDQTVVGKSLRRAGNLDSSPVPERRAYCKLYSSQSPDIRCCLNMWNSCLRHYIPCSLISESKHELRKDGSPTKTNSLGTFCSIFGRRPCGKVRISA